MKIFPFFILLSFATVVAGCAEHKVTEEKSREDAASKARADAARKEMQTLPQVFRPQYYNKRLEPEKAGAETAATESPKKP